MKARLTESSVMCSNINSMNIIREILVAEFTAKSLLILSLSIELVKNSNSRNTVKIKRVIL